jgi:putative PEP-CTERM system TPR-repeat lipoprotein
MRYVRCAPCKSGAIFAIAILAFAGLGSPVLAKDANSYLDSAQAYAEKGNLRAAEIELRNAVRQAPKDSLIRARLAQIYLKLGEFAFAEREARSARDLHGAEADYLLPLAEAMRGQGKFAAIQAEIKADHRPPELEAQVRMVLAMAALGLNDRAKAENLLREAVSINPSAPTPKIELARQLIGSKPEEAGELVNAVLAADPRSVEAIVAKGEILARKGDSDGAIQRFGEALILDPNNVNARLSRANVNLTRNDYGSVDNDLDPILKTSPANFAANYLRALKDFKKRDFAAADKILEELSSRSSNFSNLPEGLYVQAATKYALDQVAQAHNAIAKYVARAPGDVFGVRLAAMIALRRGAPDAAVEYLTEYLAKSKPDATTLTLLGNAYAKTGKSALALDQYQKAATLEPENLSLKTMVAVSEINAGSGRKGLDELEQVFASTDEGAAIAGPTLAFSELRAGRVGKAAETAEKLIKRDGNNQLYQSVLGAVRTAQRDYPAAETIFKTLADKNPDLASARVNLAAVYIAAGKSDEAKKTYQDFLAQNPDNVTVLLALADLSVREKRWDEAIASAKQARRVGSPSDPAPGLKLLGIYHGQRDWAQAKALASELVLQFPSNSDVFDAQGQVLALSGDSEGAINAYRHAYEKASNSEPILLHYLQSLESAKRYPEIRTILQSRLDKDPGNLVIKAQLIRVEEKIGGLGAGLAKAQSFAKSDPDSSRYDLVSADLYERAGKRSEAIALLKKTASARPADDSVAIALSDLYNNAGDLAEAEAVLSRRLKDRPDAVTVRKALGNFYIRNNKLELALREENQLLAERPDDPTILNNLAWLYQQTGNLPKARELAERAIGLAPANGQVADTLGWILLAQGDTQKALIHLEAASTAMPGNAEINYHFAVALGRAGRAADARAILEQVLSSGAAFTGKAEAEKLLQDLKRG